MRRFWTLLIFFPVILFTDIAAALSYRSLAEGLDYGVVEFSPTTARLHFLRVNLRNYRITPIEARDFQAAGMTVKEMAEKTEALAVLNANFFTPDVRPLGLILREGKVTNPIHPTTWWASLLIRGDRIKISKVFDPSSLRKYDTGIQAGPRLVIQGKIPKLKREISPKSAVGIDIQGNLILIASEGSIEINELAQWLAKPASKGGLGLRNALNLDGGTSTQFFVKAGEFSLSIPGLARVPVGIGVFKKNLPEKKD